MFPVDCQFKTDQVNCNNFQCKSILLLILLSNTKSTSSNNLNNTTAATPWDAGHHHYHSLAGSSGASSNKQSTSLRGTSFFSALDSALTMAQPSTSQTAGVSVSLSNNSAAPQQVHFSKLFTKSKESILIFLQFQTFIRRQHCLQAQQLHLAVKTA